MPTTLLTVQAIIGRYAREHGGDRPTAITFGPREWADLWSDKRSVEMIGYRQHDAMPTYNGVALRWVRAPGIHIIA